MTNAIEDTQKVNQTIEHWQEKSVEEKRSFCQKLSKEIQKIDRKQMSGDSDINYSYRNTLVSIKRELQKSIPFQFDIGQKVVIKYGRRIKGIVKKYDDISTKSLLVMPIDKLFKEPIIVTERLLEPDVAPFEKEGQLTLF